MAYGLQLPQRIEQSPTDVAPESLYGLDPNARLTEYRAPGDPGLYAIPDAPYGLPAAPTALAGKWGLPPGIEKLLADKFADSPAEVKSATSAEPKPGREDYGLPADIAQRLHDAFPPEEVPKQKSGLLGDIGNKAGRFIKGAVSSVEKGVVSTAGMLWAGTYGAVLDKAIGAITGKEQTTVRDAIFKKMDEAIGFIGEKLDPTAEQDSKATFADKFATAAGNVTGLIAQTVALGPGVGGSSVFIQTYADRARALIKDDGLSAEEASQIAGAEAVSNLVSSVIPVTKYPLIVKAAADVTTNVVAGAGVDALSNYVYGEKRKDKQVDPLDVERRSLDAALGVFGSTVGHVATRGQRKAEANEKALLPGGFDVDDQGNQVDKAGKIVKTYEEITRDSLPEDLKPKMPTAKYSPEELVLINSGELRVTKDGRIKDANNQYISKELEDKVEAELKNIDVDQDGNIMPDQVSQSFVDVPGKVEPALAPPNPAKLDAKPTPAKDVDLKGRVEPTVNLGPELRRQSPDTAAPRQDLTDPKAITGERTEPKLSPKTSEDVLPEAFGPREPVVSRETILPTKAGEPQIAGIAPPIDQTLITRPDVQAGDATVVTRPVEAAPPAPPPAVAAEPGFSRPAEYQRILAKPVEQRTPQEQAFLIENDSVNQAPGAPPPSEPVPLGRPEPALIEQGRTVQDEIAKPEPPIGAFDSRAFPDEPKVFADKIAKARETLPDVPLDEKVDIALTQTANSVELMSIANRAAAKMVNAPRFEVHADETTLPFKPPPGTEAAYLDGVVHLIEPNITPERRQAVVLHEITHHNILTTLGEKLGPTLDGIRLNDRVNRLAGEWQRGNIDERERLGGTEFRRRGTEEALAKISESGVQAKLLDPIIAKIRQGIRKIGIETSVNDREVRALLSSIGNPRLAEIRGTGERIEPRLSQIDRTALSAQEAARIAAIDYYDRTPLERTLLTDYEMTTRKRVQPEAKPENAAEYLASLEAKKGSELTQAERQYIRENSLAREPRFSKKEPGPERPETAADRLVVEQIERLYKEQPSAARNRRIRELMDSLPPSVARDISPPSVGLPKNKTVKPKPESASEPASIRAFNKNNEMVGEARRNADGGYSIKIDQLDGSQPKYANVKTVEAARAFLSDAKLYTASKTRDGAIHLMGKPRLEESMSQYNVDPAISGNYGSDAPTGIEKLRVKAQDSDLAIRRFQENISASGRKVEPDQDYYDARNKTGSKASVEIENVYQPLVDRFAETVNRLKISPDELGQYMTALHARERNAVIAERNKTLGRFQKTEEGGSGSGMTDLRANAILALIRQDPEKLAALEEAAALVRQATKESKRLAVEHGLLTKEEINQFPDWEHYVPLKGDPLEGQSYTATGAGLSVGLREKAALGRRSEANNPVFQVFTDLAATIRRGTRNETEQKLLNLVLAHPDPKAYSVDEIPVKYSLGPDGQVRANSDQLSALTADNVVAVKRNGNIYKITLKDKNLAEAVMFSPEHGDLTKAVGAITRFIAKGMTQYTPGFIVDNKLRDVQQASAYVAAKHGKKMAIDTLKAQTQTFKAMQQFVFKGKASDPTLEGYIQEWRVAGGKTASVGSYGFEDVKSDVGARVGKFDSQTQKIITKIGDAGIRRAAQFVEKLNTVAEDSTRLAIYVAARENGLGSKEASSLSKNATVNFDRHGRNRAMAQFYMFLNAGTQGIHATASMLKDPKTLAKVAAGLIGAGWLLSEYNFAVAPVDESGQSEWEKLNLLESRDTGRKATIQIPGGDGRTVSIAMPHGLRYFFDAGQQISLMTHGSIQPSKAVKRSVMGAVDAFNPIGIAGSEDFLKNALNLGLPTVADIGLDIAYSETSLGTPIDKERIGARYNPASDKFKPVYKTDFSTTNPIATSASKALNILGGGTDNVKGFINLSGGDLSYLARTLSGGAHELAKGIGSLAKENEDRRIQDVPVLGRLLKSAPGKELDQRIFYANMDKLNEAALRYPENKRIEKLLDQGTDLAKALGKENKKKPTDPLKRDQARMIEKKAQNEQLRFNKAFNQAKQTVEELR